VHQDNSEPFRIAKRETAAIVPRRYDVRRATALSHACVRNPVRLGLLNG
jgi:hypothetical protein